MSNHLQGVLKIILVLDYGNNHFLPLNIISMIKKFNGYVTKIPMTGINNLRIDMEKKFIN